MGPKPLILARAFGLGTGLALYVLPKRSVTALGRVYRVLQDLDARRKIITKIKRSRSNNNKSICAQRPILQLPLLIKKREISPAAHAAGLLIGAFYLWSRPEAIRAH